MSAQHGRDDTPRHRTTAAIGIATVIIVVLAIVFAVTERSTGNDTTDGQGSSASSPMTTPTTTPTPTLTTPTPTPTSSPAPTTSSAVSATSLAGLVAQSVTGGVSVSALNLTTGKKVTLGASSGMIEASVSKIALLVILLLERQEAGELLTGNEDAQLTEMIEHSSNTAADKVFDLAGGHATVVAEQKPLGLNTSITVYGPGNLWGLTTSSAAQQIVLLNNLVSDGSPLNENSRAYALNLLQHVESDQRWGVPVSADKGSTYYVKNGWLAVDSDHGLWAVNSDGIITVHGQRLLVSVMTQHQTTFAGGITFCEKLVKAAVAAVS